MTLQDEPWVDAETGANAVAIQVLRHGPISRSDIARRLRLSPGSITRLSTPLVEQGLIVETTVPNEGRAGRPSRPLDVVPESRHFVGIKLTGDRAEGVLTDLRTTPRGAHAVDLTSTGVDDVVDALVALVEHLGDDTRPAVGVGVAVGGRVQDGVVTSAPFLGWTDVPLARLLEDRLGCEVTLENDLIALTAEEHWFGAGRDLDRFAVVTVGAGVGYGLVAHGEIVANQDSGLGLVGHWPIEPFGPMCPEGHRGCARAVLTTAAIESNVGAAVGSAVDYDEAIRMAEDGHPAARRVVDDAVRGLGRLLAAIANLTVPERIILGGEGVRMVDVARPALDEGIAEARDPRASALDIVTIAADNEDWCRGAAAVAIQRYVSRTA